jgi:N-acetylglucosamine-6-phosphate deacetylase
MTRGTEAEPRRIVGTTLLPGGEIRLALISVRDGRITAVAAALTPPEERALRRTPGLVRLRDEEILAPAFNDIHCHGAGGGAADGGLDGLARMAGALLAHGVGGFLATVMTAPIPALRTAALAVAGRMVDRAAAGSTVLGLHLEGPALSPVRSAGHDPAALVEPAVLDAALASEAVAWRAVRLVTLAPELPGGLELIRRLAAAGIATSVGHTDASAEVASGAYAAGARSTTHLFNGMPPFLHRSPGPVGAALADAPFIELIADGVHVDRRILAPIARAIGADRLIFVSDAVPLAGSRLRRVPVPGSVVLVRGGMAVHPDGTLAGGRLLLDGIVGSAVLAGIPLSDALRAASENPATLLGLVDRGAVKVGARADLVIVSRAGRLRQVMVSGA